jgi:hypothetical protein
MIILIRPQAIEIFLSHLTVATGYDLLSELCYRIIPRPIRVGRYYYCDYTAIPYLFFQP